jgi:hypothetical protein
MLQFMYTMPLGIYPNGSHRVFFEETSLVGAGSRRLTFEECKKRAYKRLKYWGINVIGVEEEEYCYIPMGGQSVFEWVSAMSICIVVCLYTPVPCAQRMVHCRFTYRRRAVGTTPSSMAVIIYNNLFRLK